MNTYQEGEKNRNIHNKGKEEIRDAVRERAEWNFL